MKTKQERKPQMEQIDALYKRSKRGEWLYHVFFWFMMSGPADLCKACWKWLRKPWAKIR